MGDAWRDSGDRRRPLPLWDDPADGRTMDVLLPRSQDPADPPVSVVVLAGGGYEGRSWHEGPGTAVWLAAHGFAAAAVPYRVAGEVAGGGRLHPAPLRDACRAVRVVRDHAGPLGLDPRRVCVLGYSAGGHLAGSAVFLHGETDGGDPLASAWSGRPDAAALVYPVVSMVPPRHAGSARALLGGGAGRGELERMSLQLAAAGLGERGETPPPLFVTHATDDGVVPYAGAVELAEACRRAGGRVTSYLVPEGGHGYGLALDRPESGAGLWPTILLRWLRSLKAGA